MAKSKLEYWTGSAWTEAKTIENQNALIRLELEDSLNNAMKANITLGNAAHEPFSVDTAADRYGPLTSVFTDFMPIRIIETDSNVVLFHGKVYDIKNLYDKARGNVVKLYARDHLAELADYPTDGKSKEIAVTDDAGTYPDVINTRSELIKTIIRDTKTNPHASSLLIKSTNIDFDDTLKFTASGRTFDDEDKFSISTLGRQGLKAIYEVAKNDPHETSGDISDYGYDFYGDSQFVFNTASPPVTATNPALDFNYFKRGTRPTFESTPASFNGLTIEYPIQTAFTETGNNVLMLPDYDFNLPKRDLYTGAVAQISREVETGVDDDDKATFETKNFSLEFEILEVSDITPSGGDANFAWKNRKLTDFTTSTDTTFAEELRTSGGDKVGRIQYQSVTTGSGDPENGKPAYILLSFESDGLTDNSISTQRKNFDALDNSDHTLTGVESAATLVYNPSSRTVSSGPVVGRPSASFGLTRPLRISASDSKHVDSMRRRIASALSRAKTTRTECTVRIIPPPFLYIDTTVSSEAGSGTASIPTLALVGGVNAENLGFRIGMTIAKIDSDGAQTAHGYATLVNGAAVTAPLNTGNWDNYDGSVRLYFPVRAGHYIYAKNLLANFTGYMFLKSAVYTEEPGMQATMYKGSGVNTAGSSIGLGIDPNSILATIEGEGNKYPKEVNIPLGALGWNTTCTFTATARQTITWTAGEMNLGGGNIFQIASGTSGTLALTPTSNGYPPIYKIVFIDPDTQQPDSSGKYTFSFTLVSAYYPDMDNIVLGHARAGKLSTGLALLLFDASETGGFGGLDAVGEDQFSAALFKKTLQPWTTNVSLYPGKHTASTVYSTGTAYQSNNDVTGSGTEWTEAMIGDEFKFDEGGGGGLITACTDNTSITVANSATVFSSGSPGDYTINITATPDNLNQYIHVTNGLAGTGVNGTISFADNTTVPLNYNNGSTTTDPRPTLNLGTANSAVYYIFFKLADVGDDETSDFTVVTQAIVDRTTTYSDATSDSRGLLAICSTGSTASEDEIAIQAFHGKGQNITADVIAAGAITADAIKTGSLNSHTITLTGSDGVIRTSATVDDGTGSNENGIKISNAGIEGFNSSGNKVFFLDPATGTVTIGGGADGEDGSITFTNVKATIPAHDNAVSNTPAVNSKQYDTWITSDTNQLYVALHATTNDAITSGKWTLKDDADAINNATTTIKGGLINTQRIKLVQGGGAAATVATNVMRNADGTARTPTDTLREGSIGEDADDLTLTADAQNDSELQIYGGDIIKLDDEDLYVSAHNSGGTSFTVVREYNGTTRAAHSGADIYKYMADAEATHIAGLTTPHIIMDNYGIVGYSNAYTPEFSLSSEDGKAMFGGGVGFVDATGIHLRQQSSGTARLRFESSSGGELSSIYTNQGAGATDYTHWFTSYDGSPSTNGKEIHIGSGPDNIAENTTPQTKAIVLNAQYIGIHPDNRSVSSGPIFYRFPDDTPNSGEFLKHSGTTDDLSITGSTVTVYDLEWAAVDAPSSLVWKDNPRAIEIDTSKVLTLTPKTFTWKDIEGIGEEIRGRDDFGLIAEEVHDILPELVTYTKDNNPSGVRYRMLSVLLLEELKKLKARVDVLEAG